MAKNLLTFFFHFSKFMKFMVVSFSLPYFGLMGLKNCTISSHPVRDLCNVNHLCIAILQIERHNMLLFWQFSLPATKKEYQNRTKHSQENRVEPALRKKITSKLITYQLLLQNLFVLLTIFGWRQRCFGPANSRRVKKHLRGFTRNSIKKSGISS